jgi:DNA-binding Lrp family transcriptional regulator
MELGLLQILQSVGPMPLNELVMRLSETPEELAHRIEQLRKEKKVVVKGPRSEDLTRLTAQEILASSDITVELSWDKLRQSFAR